jgi:hypothetical protein
MTVPQIREKLSPVKPVSTPQLYRYIKVLHIEPLGARQRPQHYPEDTPQKILLHLGLTTPDQKSAVVSLRHLRTQRSKTKTR